MTIACSGSAFKGTLEEVLQQIAEAGFSFVDLIAIEGWNQLLPAKLAEQHHTEAERTAHLLEKYSLQPMTMNCAIPALYRRDQATLEQRNRQLQGIAEYMNQLDIKIASFYPGYKLTELSRPEVVVNTAETLREMNEIAAKHKLTFLLEPHYDTPFQTLEQINELIEIMPELKIAYDPSHFAAQGIDLRKTTFLFERTVHVHLRDASKGTIQTQSGAGQVPFEWLFKALRQSGYDGAYSIELLPDESYDIIEQIKVMRDIYTRFH